MNFDTLRALCLSLPDATYLADAYSLVEALLWLGIYLAMNLQLSWLNMREQWLGIHTTTASQFARPFYWTTWS
jgi:hypothetical protein